MAADRVARSCSFAVRTVTCALGAVAAIWALYVFPIDWQQAGIARVAAHIIDGEAFKEGALSTLAPAHDVVRNEKWDRPSALRNIAIIRLRTLEEAISKGDQKSIDGLMQTLHAAISESLANSPADPFLWSVLFWLENAGYGFSKAHLKYLRMSYATGPNEGWVAIKRNRLALAIFPELTPQLKEDAIAEFSRLVDSAYFSQANPRQVARRTQKCVRGQSANFRHKNL